MDGSGTSWIFQGDSIHPRRFFNSNPVAEIFGTTSDLIIVLLSCCFLNHRSRVDIC